MIKNQKLKQLTINLERPSLGSLLHYKQKGSDYMALMRVNFYSKVLGKHHHFNLILPEDDSHYEIEKENKLLPSLMILHGLSSDNNSYLRFTSVERYANDYGVAIILPDGDHSFYANMKYGHSYEDHILEVWAYAHKVFPLSLKREDNYLAGHSMGGFGAIKTSFEHPELFSKACYMSAATNLERMINYDWQDFKVAGIIGDVSTTKGTELDITAIIEKGIASNNLPELYIMCGTEDELHSDNLKFVETLRSKGVKLKFEDGPGEHDYAYWDQGIKKALEWMSN